MSDFSVQAQKDKLKMDLKRKEVELEKAKNELVELEFQKEKLEKVDPANVMVPEEFILKPGDNAVSSKTLIENDGLEEKEIDEDADHDVSCPEFKSKKCGPEEKFKKVDLPLPPAYLDYKPLQFLNFVYINLTEAQKIKGRFSMMDCKNLLNSYRLLQKFFVDRQTFEEWRAKEQNSQEKLMKDEKKAVEKEKEEDDAQNVPIKEVNAAPKVEPLADESIWNAYKILLAATEMQQNTGIFSIEGSVELLDSLVGIEQFLNGIKTPDVQRQDTKQDKKQEKKQAKKRDKKRLPVTNGARRN